ncbi:MAG: PDZ domain-containing protein [Deltaproteobacteria bacterium]|nr:PDZ domain-containing protein [Deltaproteobacteria bacterium]MDQ3300828.1 PDZ domain-containing protein [Myxococcota bacterium]
MVWLRYVVMLAGLVAVGTPIASAKSSNPAFLGIGMEDTGGATGVGPCQVKNVEAGTGAAASGLQQEDVLLALDGKPVANCDSLVAMIQMRVPGDVIKLDVRRLNIRTNAATAVVIKARLSSRDELLRQRLVGQPLPAATFVNVADRTPTELGDARTRTTIVGWFSSACDGCERVFADIARRSRSITRGAPLQIFGATAGDDGRTLSDNLELLTHHARRFDVPLLVTDADTFGRFTFRDRDRIHFMVVDCRGIVQYVAPIAPDADDTEAMLDELYAAAEQASRRMK